jgi:hypothetical protein
MKTVSPVGAAREHATLLLQAQAAVDRHPQALFSDFQWFLFEARDAVYFTAFSELDLDKDALGNIVAEMVSRAPQLTHGFVGARPGQPFPKHMLDAITEVTLVDDFEGYPDKWIGKSEDIFARVDLPLFRVQAAVRRGGPDAEGRASILQVRASHALLEGADSAMLTRSQSAARGSAMQGRKVGLLLRLATGVRGQFMAWSYIALAQVFAAKVKPWGFKTLAIKRLRLKTLAARLGVRQRSLYFALVTHGLHVGGEAHVSKAVIAVAYTLLEGHRTEIDDDFLRVRALLAKFKVKEDFLAYLREIDATVGQLEKKEITKFMGLMTSAMHNIRSLNALWKGLPGRRFWRFNMGIEMALTLVPPHRTHGPMTQGMIEPLYVGAWHPGQNICTFCPGRDYVTLNFSMEERHIARVDNIMRLLEKVEAMQLPAAPAHVVDDEP